MKVLLINFGTEVFEVKRGDRIAQVILEKIFDVPVVEVSDFDNSDTERGADGFGSSGLV